MLRIALVETSHVDAMGIYSCMDGMDIKCQPFNLCSQFVLEHTLKPFDALIIEIVPFEYGLSGALDTLHFLKAAFPKLPVIVLTRSEILMFCRESSHITLIHYCLSRNQFRRCVRRFWLVYYRA